MTPSLRARLARAEDRLIAAFYTAIVVACAAFGVMLLAPHAQAEILLSVAWLAMLAAVACLCGRLAVGVAGERFSAVSDTPR